jgi:hypothetical protein
MVLGFHGTSAAFGNDGFSYTQPAAELVLPFDVSETDRETFLIVSNINGSSSSDDGSVAAITTHWIFWSANCDELADFNVCLTLNDTIVVDPRDMQAVDKDNNRVGPVIDLTGESGLATVVAYQTNEDCGEFRQAGEILKDNTTAGYAFGIDAFGLGTDDQINPTKVVLPPPNNQTVETFDIQLFNPNTVDVSAVFLTHLREQTSGPVTPSNSPLRFATHFIDNFEVPTSLPDARVGCVLVTSIQPGLIPDSISLDSSGIVRLVPVPGLADGDFLWGTLGEALGPFGAASSLKAVYTTGGSTSRAFLETTGQLSD